MAHFTNAAQPVPWLTQTPFLYSPHLNQDAGEVFHDHPPPE
jgi:hypothetical protein